METNESGRSLRGELSGCFLREEPEGTFVCKTPPEFSGFVGHFPERPILPGFCLLQMAAIAAEKKTGKKLRIRRIKRARFTLPIEPEQVFAIALSIVQCGENEFQGKFKITLEGRPASEISCLFTQKQRQMDNR